MAIDQEEIDEARQQIVDDVAAGIQQVTADGTSVLQSDPMRRLDVLERLERRNSASDGTWGIRTKILLPPGGGGGPSPIS
jgi:hypothetical protein